MRRALAGASILAAVLAGAGVGSISSAQAAQLHVRPVGIELTAPAQASKLVLTNKGKAPLSAQVRIFRWTQKNGRDVLQRTRMVVASPPLLKMRPGREHIVRVVRLSKTPVQGEESYRLLVDEIPQKKRAGSGVTFALRYSIPVFFKQAGATPPRLSWSASVRNGQLTLRAANAGQSHDKISKLRVVVNGRTHTLFNGLAGYVLGKSTRAWTTRLKARKGAVITIKGQGLNGPFAAKVRVR